MSCLNENLLVGFVHGEVSSEEAVEVERHLDECPRCRRLVSEAVRLLGSRVDEPVAGAAEAPEESALPAGTRVGRYVVVEQIGEGGMGVVYAARDPDLDRRVALKLLHPARGARLGEGPDGERRAVEARTRLMREAQAMARLSHPNVVAVHDVGPHEGQVFIAMELVEGSTLADWLSQADRPWREVLRVLLEAGRGLAAAHAAGFIHRDFKPGNVLVGRDGRARVTDFGLANLPPGQEADDADGATPSSFDPLTRTGSVVGTPLYLAPERYAGRPADARSDQFSFCVTAYEALYRRHPYRADSFEALAQAVTEGRSEPIPFRRGVPPWIGSVIRRGLQTEPAERYPSMDALLGALARGPLFRTRRLLRSPFVRIPLGTSMILLGALGYRAFTARPDPCAVEERRLDGIWDGERRARVRAAILAGGRTFADASAAELERSLDGFAAAWTTARRRACEGTHDEATSVAAAIQTSCLDARLAELHAVTDLLLADPRGGELAVPAAQSLGRLERCTEGRVLDAPAPPERMAARARDVRQRILRARLLGPEHPDDALTAATEAVGAARLLGYRPAEAEALLALGEAQERMGNLAGAEATTREAAAAAVAARSDLTAARAWVRLVRLIGDLEGRPEEALRIDPQAAALVERFGGEPSLEVERLTNLAAVLARAGKRDAALDRLGEALVLLDRHLGGGDLSAAFALGEIGAVLGRLGQVDEALASLRRSRSIAERLLGADHPITERAGRELAAAEAASGRAGPRD